MLVPFIFITSFVFSEALLASQVILFVLNSYSQYEASDQFENFDGCISLQHEGIKLDDMCQSTFEKCYGSNTDASFDLSNQIKTGKTLVASIETFWRPKVGYRSTRSYAHLHNVSYPILYCTICYNHDRDAQLIDLVESHSVSTLGCDREKCNSISIDLIYHLDNYSHGIVFSSLLSNRYSILSDVSYFCMKHQISHDKCSSLTTEVVLMASMMIQSLMYNYPDPWRSVSDVVVVMGDTSSNLSHTITGSMRSHGVEVIDALEDVRVFPCFLVVSIDTQIDNIPCSCIILIEVRMMNVVTLLGIPNIQLSIVTMVDTLAGFGTQDR